MDPSRSSSPTRGRASLLATGTFYAIGIGLMIGGASARCRENRAAWSEVVATTRAWQAELASRDAARPVLWGPSRGSDAGAVYRDAATRLVQVGISEREAQAAADASTAQERSVRDARLKRALEAMLALRAGAHASSGPGPIDYDAGFETAVVQPMPLRTLARLAIAASRRERDGGRAEQGAYWLLDGLQLGADLLNGEPYVSEITGGDVLGIGISAFAAEAPWTEWDRDALELVAASLEKLDAAVDTIPRSLRTETVLFVRSIEGEALDALEPDWLREYGEGLRFDAWRLNQWIAFVEDLHAQGERGWKRPLEALDVLDHTADRHPSPYVRAYAKAFASVYRTRLVIVARLRLLRIAVGEVLGHDTSGIADPYAEDGAEFEREEVDGMLELRTPSAPSLSMRIPLRL